MLYLTVSLTTPMSVWLTLAVKENNNSNVKKKKKKTIKCQRDSKKTAYGQTCHLKDGQICHLKRKGPMYLTSYSMLKQLLGSTLGKQDISRHSSLFIYLLLSVH